MQWFSAGGLKSFLEILKVCSSIYGTNFRARFEVLTVMNIKITMFWKMRPCSLVNVYHLSDHTASHTLSILALDPEV
jgi:hypothetical protein